MDLLVEDPDPGDPDRLDLESSRVSERLRTMSLVRLGADRGDGRTRAGDAFTLAQDMADRSAQLLGHPQRRLPVMPPSSVGDVLAVCAHDLGAVLRSTPRSAEAEAACRWAVESLVALRLSL